MLIRRVNGVCVKSKAHKYRFTIHGFFKKRNNGNTPSTSLWNWSLTKCFFVSIVGRLVLQGIYRRNICLTTMMRINFNRYALWCYTFEMILEERTDFLP